MTKQRRLQEDVSGNVLKTLSKAGLSSAQIKDLGKFKADSDKKKAAITRRLSQKGPMTGPRRDTYDGSGVRQAEHQEEKDRRKSKRSDMHDFANSVSNKIGKPVERFVHSALFTPHISGRSKAPKRKQDALKRAAERRRNG